MLERKRKEERKHLIADRILTISMELFYSNSITYFIGRIIMNWAYRGRGYKAVGGEVFLIVLVWWLSLCVIKWILKYYRRQEND